MHGRLFPEARIPLPNDPDVIIARLQAMVPTAEQIAAYNAVVESAQKVVDHFGSDPDDALEWDESDCFGMTFDGIDALRELRQTMVPFTFSRVPRLIRAKEGAA